MREGMKIQRSVLMLSLIATLLVTTCVVGASGQEMTTIAAPEIVDPTAAPDTEIAVLITIDDVEDLWGFEFYLEFDPSVLYGLWVEIAWPFIGQWEIDNQMGYVFVTATLPLGWPLFSTTDPYTIVIIYFEVLEWGYSPLNLHSTILADWQGSIIPHEVDHGFFTNVIPVYMADLARWRVRSRRKAWDSGKWTTNDLSAFVKNYGNLPVAVLLEFTLTDADDTLWSNGMALEDIIPRGGKRTLTWTITSADLNPASISGIYYVRVDGYFDSDGDGFVDAEMARSPVVKRFKVS